MNTYYKYAPNVFLAKCEQPYQKGQTIQVQTKRGKENECIVFNLIGQRGGYYYYSIVRADGFNVQEWAKRRSERWAGYAISAAQRSNQYYEKSQKHSDFLSLGEPIKVGHHSEKRHRRIIEQADHNMGKSVEFSDRAESHQSKAEYWAGRTDTINLSMPESIEYYQYKLEEAKELHAGIKSGKYPREHSFSLPYAKKDVNEMQKKYDLAIKLWGDTEPENE